MNVQAVGESPRRVARRFAGATLAYTVFVILFGAIVRITGSGAGCGQHWPTCHGDIAHLPRTLSTAIELTHRVTSGLALVAVMGLFVITLRHAPPGHPARKLALATLALMVVEALIGAGLVLLALVGNDGSVARAVVMPLHLVSTYALTGVMTLLVVWRDETSRLAVRSGEARLIALSALALVVVSATGAVTALGDTLYPPEAASLGRRLASDQSDGAHFLARLRVLHPVLAVLAAGFIAHTARRLAGSSMNPRLRGAGRAVLALTVTQLAAGVLNVLLSAPGWLQVVHLALALALWIAFVVLAYESRVTPFVPAD